MSLSGNLQRLRKEKGLSQEDVAQKLFVSRQSVSKWENGAAEPGVESLKALAELYGVTVDELLGTERSAEEYGPTPWPWPDKPRWEATPAPRPVQDFSEGDYRAQVVIRVVLWAISTLWTFSVAGTFIIPLAMLVMILGVWVKDAWVWVVMIVLLVIDTVTCLAMIGLGWWYVLNAAISALFLFLMARRSIRARFLK